MRCENNPDQRFPKRRRLLRPTEFSHVFAGRWQARDRLLLLVAARNQLGYSRLGLSVSRRVGTAVVRNLWKRRIREAFRTQYDRLPSGLDLVVVPKAPDVPTFDDLCRSLIKLGAKLQRSDPSAR